MTTGNPCTPSVDSQWSPVGNWECPQYHLQRIRRTPPMPEEQRPKPNTTVTNSSGQEWESKALHGKYPQRVKQADVDEDKTIRWLKAAGLIAAQDQSLLASWYQHNILWKPEEGPKCRLCGRFDETIDILVSANLNWLKLNTPTATKRQLHTCIGRSSKSLALRWRNDGMSMIPRLSPRRTASHHSVGHAHPHWQDHRR